MKKLVALLLALAMSFSLVACGGAPSSDTGDDSGSDSTANNSDTSSVQDPIVISVSHSYTELDQISVELNTAAENISQRTNGAVVLNLYPNNTFGNLVDGVEAIMADSPLLLVTAFAQWEDLYYDSSALQCGFVFESGEEFLELMNTDFFQTIVDELDKVNVHALNCSFVGGMRHVIGKAPYRNPEEIKGLKLRVPNATSYIECFEAMGASPMGMAASEQISALSAGTIDALDQSISLMYSTKSYELVKHVTLIAQQPLADSMFCSTTWWNTIPAEYQDIIEDELHQAGLRYNEYSVQQESVMREEMEAAGVQFYEADREAYMEVAGDLVQQFSIADELLAALEEIRAAK